MYRRSWTFNLLMRPLKWGLLFYAEIGVLLVGLFLSAMLAVVLDSPYAFFAGLVASVGCFALVLRTTRKWKFEYDVEGERLEREERQLHPRRTKYTRAARRFLIWVPSTIAAFVLFFFPVATHMMFCGAGRLVHYQVPVPLSWTILPSFGAGRQFVTGFVGSTSSERYCIMAFWKLRPYASLTFFWGPNPEAPFVFLHKRTDERVNASTDVSSRDFSLGRTTLTCWEYLPPHHWRAWDLLPPGYWEVECETPTEERARGFYASFSGRKEDIPSFYAVVSKVKQVD